jgi:hypothetical protein
MNTHSDTFLVLSITLISEQAEEVKIKLEIWDASQEPMTIHHEAEVQPHTSAQEKT